MLETFNTNVGLGNQIYTYEYFWTRFLDYFTFVILVDYQAQKAWPLPNPMVTLILDLLTGSFCCHHMLQSSYYSVLYILASLRSFALWDNAHSSSVVSISLLLQDSFVLTPAHPSSLQCLFFSFAPTGRSDSQKACRGRVKECRGCKIWTLEATISALTP